MSGCGAAKLRFWHGGAKWSASSLPCTRRPPGRLDTDLVLHNFVDAEAGWLEKNDETRLHLRSFEWLVSNPARSGKAVSCPFRGHQVVLGSTKVAIPYLTCCSQMSLRTPWAACQCSTTTGRSTLTSSPTSCPRTTSSGARRRPCRTRASTCCSSRPTPSMSPRRSPPSSGPSGPRWWPRSCRRSRARASRTRRPTSRWPTPTASAWSAPRARPSSTSSRAWRSRRPATTSRRSRWRR